jgi:hypothetical protein
MPNDQRARATRIGGQFGERIGQALDLGLAPASVDPLLDKLDPPATAQPLGVRAGAMAGGEWTVNWDDVDLIPQPTNYTCWAAAAAMVVGWRDHLPLSPEAIAQICGRSTGAGLASNDNAAFAAEMGLTAEQPLCYIEEGFRRLLTRSGPLWVSEHPDGNPAGNFHAVVVTGMYFDGSDYFVRIADPWDRTIGTPGSPGGYASTHTTGSRYIMRWVDFARQYEGAISGDPPNQQILHANGPHGHVPNILWGATPPGFAMSTDGRPARSLAAPPSPRARQLDLGAAATIAGTLIQMVGSNSGDINWSLANWSGVKHPNDTAPATSAAFQDGAVMLRDWPMVGGTFGLDDIYAWLRIRWQYNGTSLGRVYVEDAGHDDAAGWGLNVTASLEDDSRLYPRSQDARVPGADQVPALHVNVHYAFNETIADDQVARTRVTLYADGTYDMNSEWVQHSRPGGGTPRNVARTA